MFIDSWLDYAITIVLILSVWSFAKKFLEDNKNAE
jgi:hypothetical protein